jgi:hypothetical protein
MILHIYGTTRHEISRYFNPNTRISQEVIDLGFMSFRGVWSSYDMDCKDSPLTDFHLLYYLFSHRYHFGTWSLRIYSVITTFLQPSTNFIQQLLSLVIQYPALDLNIRILLPSHYSLFSSFDSSNIPLSDHIYKRLPFVHPYICAEHKFISLITVV